MGRRVSTAAILLVLLRGIPGPGAAGARVPGIPPSGLSWILLAGAISLAVVAGLVAPQRKVSSRLHLLLAALILAKWALAGAAPALGWRGVYFMDGSTRVEFKDGPFTTPFRVDRRIFFERAHMFGLHFLPHPGRDNANFSPLERQFEYPLRVEVDWLHVPADSCERPVPVCRSRAWYGRGRWARCRRLRP